MYSSSSFGRIHIFFLPPFFFSFFVYTRNFAISNYFALNRDYGDVTKLNKVALVASNFFDQNTHTPIRMSSHGYYDNHDHGGGDRRRGRGRGGGGGYNRLQPQPPSSLNETESEALYRGYDTLFKKHRPFTRVERTDESLITKHLFTTPRWSLERMQALKTKLNDTRNRLNEKDIEKWHQHTRQTNFTGRVVVTLRNKMDVEMCTNAWIKMAELHSHYKFIPASPHLFRSLHVCEAPGAFIASTNHFFRQQHQDKAHWEWTGFSLNPYYEGNDLAAMVDDDRMIIETYQKWYFGVDNSGNIFHHDNIRGIWHERVGTEKVQLVTGDGSVDCSSDPNEQELLVSELHYAEAVCALGALAIGGHLVLKMFNLFECETVCLLYMLATYFDNLYVSKPATSKSANAETYVIGKGFRGITTSALERLMEFVSPKFPEGRAMLPRESIPESFMNEMYACAEFFTTCQKQAIERNLDLEQLMNHPIRSNLRDLVNRVADEYVRLYNIHEIPKELRLMPDLSLNGAMSNLGNSMANERGGYHKRTGGNLQERQEKKRHHEEYLENGTGKATEGDSGTSGSGSLDDHTAKRRKRDNMNGATVVHGRIPIQTDSDGGGIAAPADDAGEKGPSGGGIAKRMMEKMGYEEGKGLGKDNQGRAEAITVEQRQERAGLGHYQSGGGNAAEVMDEPFFDTWDWTKCKPCDNTLNVERPLTRGDLEELGCITIGDVFAGVITSQFTRSEDIEALYRARESALRTALARPEDDKLSFASLSARLFISGILPELGIGFGYATTALQIASLDRALDAVSGIRLGSQHEPMRFVDLGCRDGGFAEYVVWQQRGYVQGVAFPRDEQSAPYDTTRFRQQVLEVTSPSFPAKAFLQHARFSRDPIDVRIQVESFIGSRDRGLVSLVLADVSVPLAEVPETRFVEHNNQREFLTVCRNAFTLLAPHGTFVCKLSDTLTRFTAGLLYFLYRSFARITIIKPFTLHPHCPDRFVVAQNFLGQSDAVIAHLEKVEQTLASLPKGTDIEFNVVEIVPIRRITLPTEPFMSYITGVTRRLMWRETAAINKMQMLENAIANGQQVRVDTIAAEVLRAKGKAQEMLLTSPREIPPPTGPPTGPQWRRHYSKNQRKHYYYNAETKESVWESSSWTQV